VITCALLVTDHGPSESVPSCLSLGRNPETCGHVYETVTNVCPASSLVQHPSCRQFAQWITNSKPRASRARSMLA
jgi:hypothetical protein